MVSVVPGNAIDMDYIGDNPEAIFDLITMKSIQDRYGNIESPRAGGHDELIEDEAVFQNEAEFVTYVHQFPIDDSIAECFADSEAARVPGTKFVSGGKRPQGSTTYSKLKKRFGWKSADDNLLPEDDTRSRDTKRSKKRGVLSKRHKWRSLNNSSTTGSKKSVNFSDQSDHDNAGHVIDGAWRDMSRAYHDNAGHVIDGAWRDMSRVYHNSGITDCSLNDSNSVSDSQITSFSDTLTQDEDQTVPLITGGNSRPFNTVTALVNKNQRSDFPRGNSIPGKAVVSDCFSPILSGDTTAMIQKMEDIPPEEALRLRDNHGNTLLHRCVLLGNPDTVKFILEKYPEMTSDMNIENETSVELAAKNGQYDCLKVMLERNQRRKSLGPSLVHRLLNICAQHGQADCLGLLLSYTSRVPHSACSLPSDARGNTAAHLAARQGHLHCLQTLVASGYDVTSENRMQQRPLHVAHQSRSHTCFEYLLLLNVCEELLKTLTSQSRIQIRQQEHITSVRTSMEHARYCLGRYQQLFTETHRSLTDSKVDIMETLAQLQNDLELFIKHTRSDSAAKRKEARDKLDELGGEIERLEDTFEFSPLSEMDNALSRLFSSLDDAISASNDVTQKADDRRTTGVSVIDDKIDTVLSSLIQEVHKEFMLENWDTKHLFDKHLSRLVVSTANTGSDKNGQFNEKTHSTDAVEQGCSKLTQQTSVEQGDNTNNIKRHNVHKPETPNVTVKSSNTVNATQTDVITSTKIINDTNNETKNTSHLLNDVVSPTETKGNPNDTNVSDVRISTKSNGKDESNISTGPDKSDNADDVEQTERPFTKLLSLEERMDLLISGERAREKQLDSETSSETNKDTLHDPSGSVYTTTFTSITSESTSGASDWFSKLDFTSLETSADGVTDNVTDDITSGSASYWWDVEDSRHKSEHDVICDGTRLENDVQRITTTFGENVKNQIHLNLGNEDSSFEELRRQRLLNHLRSMQQSRYVSDNFRECITTSSGDVMGGFHTPLDQSNNRVVIDVKGALQNRQDLRSMQKPRKKGKHRLFTLEDAIETRQMDAMEFHERYERPRDRDASVRWEDMSFTDEDEKVSLPWYDMNGGHLPHWQSETETSDGSLTPQSYV